MNTLSHFIEQILQLHTEIKFSDTIFFQLKLNNVEYNKFKNSHKTSLPLYMTDILTSKVGPKNFPDRDAHNTISKNPKACMCMWKIGKAWTVLLSIFTTLSHITTTS